MSKCKHANGPTGYLARLVWLERMSKRYKQSVCSGCGLYAKWSKDNTEEGKQSLREKVTKLLQGDWISYSDLEAGRVHDSDDGKKQVDDIMQLFQAELESIRAELPERVNGKELNLTISATALLGADPHVVKVAQGEGWDMLHHRVTTIIDKAIEELQQ